VAGVAAAAVVLALILSRPSGPEPAQPEPPVQGIAAEEEPYPVASAEDVEINSMDHADVVALVVGEPPLREPLVLVSPRDISVESVEPDVDGVFPDMRLLDGPVTPMVRMPLSKEE